MKPDQERVKNLLTDTVSLLCRNGLAYQDELKVEGLIGITLDNNEVFLVHINQTFSTGGGEAPAVPQLPVMEPATPTPVSTAEIKDRKRSLNNQPPPSPGSHSDSTDSPSPKPSPAVVEGVKIKQEPDLFIVKTEKIDFDTSERVPPLHGTADVSMSSGSSNRQGSSSNLSNMGDNMSAPPAKRRATGDPSGAGGGAFISGMVRNFNSGNMQWTNPNMSQDINQGNNSQMSMEALAGCSNWSPGGGGGMDPNAMLNPNDPAMVGSLLLFVFRHVPLGNAWSQVAVAVSKMVCC